MAHETAARAHGLGVATTVSTAIATKSGKADLARPARQKRLLVVLLVVNLHIMRNIPGVGVIYYAIFGVVALLALLDFFALAKFRAAPDRHFLGIWVLMGLTGIGASIATISLSGSAYGLVRFWFALPLYIALLAYCRDKSDVVAYTRLATYFFTIAVLTIPLQVIIGPINWFKEGSERGEFARYASLLGGLNAAGGTAGVFIVLCQLIPGWKKWALTALIAASVVMDLSKSGIVSTAVALVVVLLMNVRKLPSLVAGGVFAATCAYFIYTFVPAAQQRLETSLISFGIESESGLRNSDKTVEESAMSRLTDLPLHNIETWLALPGFLKFPLGGGFGMASSALVPSKDSIALMSHNQFVEILTVWGVVGVVAFGAVFWSTARRLGRSPYATESPESRRVRLIFFVAFVLLMGRYMFANGSLYHPASATPLFLCMVAAAIYSYIGSSGDSAQAEPIQADQGPVNGRSHNRGHPRRAPASGPPGHART